MSKNRLFKHLRSGECPKEGKRFRELETESLRPAGAGVNLGVAVATTTVAALPPAPGSTSATGSGHAVKRPRMANPQPLISREAAEVWLGDIPHRYVRLCRHRRPPFPQTARFRQ